jgi:hypothetical protein
VFREVFAHSTLLFDATTNHTPAVSFRKGLMWGILSTPGTRPAGLWCVGKQRPACDREDLWPAKHNPPASFKGS